MRNLLSKLMSKIETRIIFYPMRKYFDPMLPELENITEEVYFDSEGHNLKAWYIKGEYGRPVILYCHGQAEHIAFFQKPYQLLAEQGYGVFAFEYRGHGKCEGTPSECGIYRDLDAAVEYLKREKGIHEKDIVVWGRSMGGAVAAEAGTKYDFCAVILESTFTTLKETAEYIIRSGCKHEIFSFKRKLLFRLSKFFPVKQTFNTVGKIHKIKSPLLILHSKKDLIVHYEMAEKNAEVHGNARLFISEDGSHDHSDWAYDEIFDFLSAVSLSVH